MRFDVVLNIPSPYRVYLLQKLEERVRALGYEFCAHFMARGHGERPKSWQNPDIEFQHRYWRDCSVRHHHFNPGLIARLVFGDRSDVLLVGSPFDTLTGIALAFFARAKIKACWVEGNTKTPGRMDGIVGFFKRLVLSRFEYVAVPGRDAAHYIALHQSKTRLRMPKPVYLPNLVNESRFRPRSSWPQEQIAACRSKMGANDNDKICLVPARLSPVKGIVPFICALNASWLRGWRIIIIGQGELREEIQRIALNKGVGDKLMLMDYVPYEEMPLFYAAADLFLLPSLYDPNPLSVPEALHSGLPVALSDQAGNVEEGVEDGVNGWRLPVNDRLAFARVLESVFDSNIFELRKKGGASLKCNSQFWSTDTSIERFLSDIGI